ncbi:MAG TPA: hypothetical protein VGC13_22460 [Longimicrobium sp.]|jgi:hypothetical protein|uniref:hypothetical protein n=1 Tax=Longimicrobium sp. TaxID=2029185 RepID=UPI002ED8EF55
MAERGGKGDVANQKARWRKRQRERRDRDPVFATRWRAQRRYEKACARHVRACARALSVGLPVPPPPKRPDEQVQYMFDVNPTRCRTCNGAIADGALYCKRARCNPHIWNAVRRGKQR